MADRSVGIPGPWRTPLSGLEGLRFSRAPVMLWCAEPTLGTAVQDAPPPCTGKTLSLKGRRGDPGGHSDQNPKPWSD